MFVLYFPSLRESHNNEDLEIPKRLEPDLMATGLEEGLFDKNKMMRPDQEIHPDFLKHLQFEEKKYVFFYHFNLPN